MLNEADDNTIELEEENPRVKEVKRIIVDIAEGRSVKAKFKQARRGSDLTQVRLKGQKEAVLALPLKILDGLAKEDLELMESSGDKRAYVLTFVVTERLEQQEVSTPERRAKLQNFLSREMD